MRRLLVITLVAGIAAIFQPLAFGQEELPRCDAGDAYPVGPEPLEGERLLLTFTDFDSDPRVYELVLTTADASEINNLTHDLGISAEHATWSPDASQIAYTSDEGGGYHVWVVDVTGENRRQLTVTSGDWPAWSPDGTTIAFVGPGTTLSFVDVRGCDERPVFEAPGQIDDVAWSPDGSLVAFVVKVGEEDPQIYSISIPVFEVTQLTDDPGGAVAPNWSADGSEIVFKTYSRSASIWAMRADGDGEYPLINTGTNDFHPALSPDGTRIALERIVDEASVVSVIQLSDGETADIIVSPFGGPRYQDPLWVPGPRLDAVVPVPPWDGADTTVVTVAASPTTAPVTTAAPATTAAASTSDAPPATGSSAETPVLAWILAGAIAVIASFAAGMVFQARRDPLPPSPPPLPPE